MNLRFRRPELIPTLFMLGTVTLMFSLGVWQLERLQWKNALLARIDEAQSEAPRNLLSYRPYELPDAEWHNVKATGVLLSDKELYATPRYLNDQLGYAILTPLAVSTPHGMEYVLVNRGWVPPDKKDPSTRPEGHQGGLVTVTGVIRRAQEKRLFTPENDPDRNMWFWYDLTAMAKHVDLPLLPVLIDATEVKRAGADSAQGPTPFPIEIKIRNDHLGYAITWFLIGLTAIVMYVLYYREKNVVSGE